MFWKFVSPLRSLQFCVVRFTTYTQLKYACEHQEDLLKNCLTYAEVTENGSNFIDAYFKLLMDTSLLYRMFPADSPGKKYVALYITRNFRAILSANDVFFLNQQQDAFRKTVPVWV